MNVGLLFVRFLLCETRSDRPWRSAVEPYMFLNIAWYLSRLASCPAQWCGVAFLRQLSTRLYRLVENKIARHFCLSEHLVADGRSGVYRLRRRRNQDI